MSNKITTLIIKQLQEQITAEELKVLDTYASESEENKQMLAELTDLVKLSERVKQSYEWYNEEDLHKIKSGLRPRKVFAHWYYAAAAVLIIAFTGYYLYKPNKEKQTPIVRAHTTKSIYFKALLKRSNGDIMKLDDLHNLSEQGPEIKRNKEFPYPINNNIPDPAMNTLQTSKESFYSIKLPDGSIVWLNCASSLVFPSSFSGPERIVGVYGEAYFDIAEDASRPFKVQVPGMEIVVTGTKFNVKAYNDDRNVRTTLIEGSVKIKTKNKTHTLKAGEQALLTNSGKLEKNGSGNNIKAILAWKENQFDWDKEHLETIIGDICRWYGLQPDYRTNVSSGTYSATITRSRPLYQILAILEAVTPYKYTIEDQRLIIRQR